MFVLAAKKDGSFEYRQHMFWMRNKKIIFSYALLSGGGGRGGLMVVT